MVIRDDNINKWLIEELQLNNGESKYENIDYAQLKNFNFIQSYEN